MFVLRFRKINYSPKLYRHLPYPKLKNAMDSNPLAEITNGRNKPFINSKKCGNTPTGQG